MPPALWAFLGAVVGAIPSILLWRSVRRKNLAESLSTDSATSARLFEELSAARSRILGLEGVVAELQGNRERLIARVAHLEAALPAALLSSNLDSLSLEQLEVLDESTDPMTISTPTNGGQFLFVNRAFCEALGRSKEEILALGWRGLIVEEDLPQTLRAEASAWSGPGRVINRYRHADGSLVTFRWIFPRYTAGVALSIAKV